MRLRDLVGAVPAATVRGDLSVAVTAVVHDTRAVVPGALFCCVRGSAVDGHDLAPAAVGAGAAALVVDHPIEADVPQVVVDSVRAAMGPLAARFHGDPSRAMLVLGVTGTNGKTTTTYLLEAITEAAGMVPGVIGTTGSRVAGEPLPATLTTPEATELQPLLGAMRDQGVSVVAMEVSSHALVQHRVDGTRFTSACFLNLSHDHLDFHGSLDEYFEAKALLFDPDRTRGAAVNLDDPRGPELVRRCRQRNLGLLTYSSQPGSHVDVGVSDVSLRADGTRFRLAIAGEYQRPVVETPLVGRFNLANCVAAAATALAAGLPVDALAEGLGAPTTVPGRFERVDRGQPFTVLVDYAHTPDALAQALASAREVAEGRVLVVFGCGGDRDRAKRPVMGAAAAAGADALFVTSDNPRSEDPQAIVDEILAGIPAGAEPVVELERRGAIRRALTDARPGDVVVVAGKGHETGQTIGDTVVPFDDRLVVVEELEVLGCA